MAGLLQAFPYTAHAYAMCRACSVAAGEESDDASSELDDVMALPGGPFGGTHRSLVSTSQDALFAGWLQDVHHILMKLIHPPPLMACMKHSVQNACTELHFPSILFI